MSAPSPAVDPGAAEAEPAGGRDLLRALPRELLEMVCALLPPADLVTLGQLSRDWRRLAREPALWRNVTLDLGCRSPAVDRERAIKCVRTLSTLFSLNDTEDEGDGVTADDDTQESSIDSADDAAADDSDVEMLSDGGAAPDAELSDTASDVADDDKGAEADTTATGRRVDATDKAFVYDDEVIDINDDEESDLEDISVEERVNDLNDSAEEEMDDDFDDDEDDVEPCQKPGALLEHEDDALAEEEDWGFNAEEDREAVRVLRAAPCLRCIRINMQCPGPLLRRAVRETSATVRSLHFTTFMAELEEAVDLVRAVAPSLECLRMAEVRTQALQLLAGVRLPRLRSLRFDSVMEYPKAIFLANQELKLLPLALLPFSAPPRIYHTTPVPLIDLLAGVRDTLRELVLGTMWMWHNSMDEVLAAAAECRGLERMRTFCCGAALRRLWPLPALRTLSLVLLLHDDADLNDKFDGHGDCLAAVPAGVEDLKLWLLLARGREITLALEREAPRLSALRRLTVHFMLSVEEPECAVRLRAAFPGVEVRSDCGVDLADLTASKPSLRWSSTSGFLNNDDW